MSSHQQSIAMLLSQIGQTSKLAINMSKDLPHSAGFGHIDAQPAVTGTHQPNIRRS